VRKLNQNKNIIDNSSREVTDGGLESLKEGIQRLKRLDDLSLNFKAWTNFRNKSFMK